MREAGTVATPHHSTVRLDDGTELALQRAGSGPILLLLPGQANSHAWWTGLREAFEGTCTTVTFDYRGTGATRASEDDTWTTASFADDALRVLDACDAGTAHVYATSMGGRVAQLLAARAPDRVDRLVLACTSPGGPLAVERGTEVRRALSRPDPAARRRALLDLMYTPVWFARGVSSHLLGDPRMTPRARSLHLRASDGHDASGVLGAITAPTLVLHGDDDPMTPSANAEVLHRAIPGSRLHLTPGGRHGFFDEFALDTTTRVLDFLHA
jgi:pimeloyl-ACP methyl ester carboxylesterase